MLREALCSRMPRKLYFYPCDLGQSELEIRIRLSTGYVPTYATASHAASPPKVLYVGRVRVSLFFPADFFSFYIHT